METKITSRSSNSTSILHYQYYGAYRKNGKVKYNQPHKNNNGVKVRNRYIDNINCPIGYKGAVRAFNYYNHRKPNNKNQCMSIVLSFSKHDFNFDDKDDVLDAVGIGRELVHRVYPNHSAVVFAQDDNSNKTPHLHIVVSMFDHTTLKSIQGKGSNLYYLRRVSNQIGDEYNRTHPYNHILNMKRYSHELRHSNHRRSYRHISKKSPIIVQRLEKTLNDVHSTSKAKFKQIAKENGLDVKFVKARSHRRKRRRGRHKKGRRYSRRKYRARRRNGVAVRLSGKTAKGYHHRYVGLSTLKYHDSRFTYNAITKVFKRNRSIQHRLAVQRHVANLRAYHKKQQRLHKASVASAKASVATVRPKMASSSASVSTASSAVSMASMASSTSSALVANMVEPPEKYHIHDKLTNDWNRLSNNNVRRGFVYGFKYVIPLACEGKNRLVKKISKLTRKDTGANKSDENILKSARDYMVGIYHNRKRDFAKVWYKGNKILHNLVQKINERPVKTSKFLEYNRVEYRSRHSLKFRWRNSVDIKNWEEDASDVFTHVQSKLKSYLQPIYSYNDSVSASVSRSASESGSAVDARVTRANSIAQDRENSMTQQNASQAQLREDKIAPMKQSERQSFARSQSASLSALSMNNPGLYQLMMSRGRSPQRS